MRRNGHGATTVNNAFLISYLTNLMGNGMGLSTIGFAMLP